MGEARTHSGGCHCGAVRYSVTTDLAKIIDCNCSICTKTGILWSFVSPERFVLQSGTGMLTSYRFHTEHINHLFCARCGVESFARGADPQGNEMVAINVRCLDDINLSGLKTIPVDGKRF